MNGMYLASRQSLISCYAFPRSGTQKDQYQCAFIQGTLRSLFLAGPGKSPPLRTAEFGFAPETCRDRILFERTLVQDRLRRRRGAWNRSKLSNDRSGRVARFHPACFRTFRKSRSFLNQTHQQRSATGGQ